MDSRSTLDALMARYQAGDFAAVTALVEASARSCIGFFMAQSASRSDADDLLQETWLRIHRVRHTYRSGEPVLPWFYAIARRVRIDHYRRASRTTARERRLEEGSDVAAMLPPEEAQADPLEALLAPLSEREREVIRDDEGGGDDAAGGRPGDLLQRRVGEAESASRLQEAARTGWTQSS